MAVMERSDMEQAIDRAFPREGGSHENDAHENGREGNDPRHGDQHPKQPQENCDHGTRDGVPAPDVALQDSSKLRLNGSSGRAREPGGKHT
jgi:hypothetical protein